MPAAADGRTGWSYLLAYRFVFVVGAVIAASSVAGGEHFAVFVLVEAQSAGVRIVCFVIVIKFAVLAAALGHVFHLPSHSFTTDTLSISHESGVFNRKFH